MSPQRSTRGRARRILDAKPALRRRIRRAAILASVVAGAGCASVSESPREPYAVPGAAVLGSDRRSGDEPSFSIAEGRLEVGSGASADIGIVEPGLASGRLGLFAAERFELASGGCDECGVPAAALWWFREEVIAVPRTANADATTPASAESIGAAGAESTVANVESAGADAASAEPAGADASGAEWLDDASAAPLPAIVWLGAPQRIEGARLSADAREVRVGEESLELALTPPLPTNAAYADASTARFFSGRPLTIRGAVSGGARPRGFVARSIFPEDLRIDLRALRPAPLRPNELLGTLIEAQTSERYRLLFARSDPAGWGGLPVLALVLTGAQGDDDGSRAGHLAAATGVLGTRGEWDDWLVTNFYPLVEGNAKGIIPASLPMDSYLYDLNSGQLYYRPGYMLVAVLARPRAAIAVQRALQRTMLALHCGSIEFDRARRNSTAMTIDPLRELGWRIPAVGPTSRVAGVAAAPVAAIVRRRLGIAGSVYATFSTERTRLLPRVAFEVAGHDLLVLAALGARDGQELTPFERLIAEDVEGLLFVRLEQVPSSRRFGSYPVPSLWAYGAGLLSDPGDYEAAPEAGNREFPPPLRGTCGG